MLWLFTSTEPFTSLVSSYDNLFILEFEALILPFFVLLLQPQHQRGAAHCLSMTAMSLFKAAGPACGGLL